MLLMLIPSVIYFVLFIGQQFPATERAAAGVPASEMVSGLLHAALPRGLGVHVADGLDRARTGHLDSDDLQSPDSRPRRRPASSTWCGSTC